MATVFRAKLRPPHPPLDGVAALPLTARRNGARCGNRERSARGVRYRRICKFAHLVLPMPMLTAVPSPGQRPRGRPWVFHIRPMFSRR